MKTIIVFLLLATVAVANPPQAVKPAVANGDGQPRVTNVQEIPPIPGKREIIDTPGRPGVRITTLEEPIPEPPPQEYYFQRTAPVKPTYVKPTYVKPTYIPPTTYAVPHSGCPAPSVQYVPYAYPAPSVAYIPLNVGIAAGATVDDYRTGVFGLKRNVHTAGGTVIHYGPLGRPRRTTR